MSKSSRIIVRIVFCVGIWFLFFFGFRAIIGSDAPDVALVLVLAVSWFLSGALIK